MLMNRRFPFCLVGSRWRLHLIAFFAIVVVAVLLRLIFFQGYLNSDPSEYARLANDLAQGIVHVRNYDNAAGFRNRFGTYAPVAGFIKLFGLSEVTLSIYPFLASLASLLLVYILSRHLFKPLTGLISMALLAVLPFDIAMSSTLYADPIAAAWANAGMVLLVVWLNTDNQRLSAGLAVLAGLCFGISWLCKESIAYLSPFVIGYLLFTRRQQSLRNIIYVGLGSISVLVAESVFYEITAGDFLFHFHELQRNEEQSYMFHFGDKSVYFGWSEGGYVKALAKRLLLSGPSHLLTAFNALPAFAMIAIAWGVVVKDQRFLIPGVWLITLLAFFNFGSMSFVGYKPMPLNEHYFYLVIFPAVILVSGLVATLLKSGTEWNLRQERRFWAGATSFAFVLLCIKGVGALKERPEQMALDAAMKLSSSDIVYTDYRTAASLVFFRHGLLLRSDWNTVPYENLATSDMHSGAYVLINKPMTEYLAKTFGYSVPEFVNNPPKAWKEVWREYGATLFREN